MHTFTFYSYKGGVGRTLVVANVARYLSRFNQNVVALDFDLEAPGLHYKLNLDAPATPLPVERGVVDYFHECFSSGSAPDSFHNFFIQVPKSSTETGAVHLMAAGNVPEATYWRKLAQINWHDFFYAPGASGVPFFLELKERIREEFNPDFLLIDARTGITEIGGVATTILPDKVVVLLLNNRENLDGARAVLRSLRHAERPPNTPPVQVIPAISRIPRIARGELEEELLESATSFLNEPAENLEDTLEVNDLFILHSEPELQLEESLRVGGDKSPDESVLLRDYLRLFNHLIPREVIRPHLGRLIEHARELSWDDPDGAQKELELLAEYGHPDAYRALLKFYRLRNISGTAALRAAERLWDIAQQADEPLLWEVVKENFGPPTPRSMREISISLDFVDRIWRARGSDDLDIAFALSDWYESTDQPTSATKTLLDLVQNVGHNSRAVTRCLRQLFKFGKHPEARDIIKEHADALSGAPDFVREWGRFALEVDAQEDLQKLSSPPLVDMLEDTSPGLAFRLLLRCNKEKQADRMLDRAVDALERGGPREMEEFVEAFADLSGMREIEARLKGRVPEEFIEEIKRLRKRRRPPFRRSMR